VFTVPVDSIAPNPRQPRGAFDLEELEDLAASIREHGVLQPLIVTQAGEQGSYNLIAGERRWRAAMLAGLEQVPVIVKEASSRGMLELALVENLQRADLNPLEEATAYRALVDDFGMKQDEVADRVGKSRQAVANSLRLLRLPPAIQEALVAGTITEGHARALLQVPDAEMQLQLAERIASAGLSVRQVEALARRLAEIASAEEETPDDEATEGESDSLYDPIRDLEEQFRNALGTKVQLSRSRRGGRLVIYFYSDEELQRIYGTFIRDEQGR
jgi:ParB family chromosome partitioning protein